MLGLEDAEMQWPSLCGNGSDGGIFWDGSLTFNSSYPALPRCFQDTAVVWTESAFLWLPVLIYLPWLLKSDHKTRTPTRYTCLYAAKLVLSLSLLTIWVTVLVFVITQWWAQQSPPLSRYMGPMVFIPTYIMTCILHRVELVKGVHTSGVLTQFWLALVIFGIFPLLSHVDRIKHLVTAVDYFQFSLFFLHYGLVLIQLVISFFVDLPDRRVPDAPTRGHVQLRSDERPLLSFIDTNSLERLDSDVASQRAPSPEETHSFFTNVSCSWILPLLMKGYREPILFDHLPDIEAEDRAARVVQVFDKDWMQRQRRHEESGRDGHPSMVRSLIVTCWWPFLIGGFTRLCLVFAAFVDPVLLQLVVSAVSGDDPYYVWKGLALGGTELVMNLWYAFLSATYMKHGARAGMILRSALTASLYRKALRLGPASHKTTSAGELANLISADAQKIQDTFLYLHEIWACPLTCILGVYYLWQIVGIASLAGLLVLVIILPLAAYGQIEMFAKLHTEQNLHRDQRLRLMGEILSAIKVLKMYAWEPAFMRDVTNIRNQEVTSLRTQAYLHSAIGVAWICAPALVCLAVFTTYVLIDEKHALSAHNVFITLSIVWFMNASLTFLAIWLAYVAQARAAVGRISHFLCGPEIEADIVQQDARMSEAVKISHATVSWAPDEEPILHNVSLDVHPGQLVMVVGCVGAGKTALLHSILGEMCLITGDIAMKGSVAFVPQQAWVQNESLQNNILFGEALDEERYEEVLEACVLDSQMDLLYQHHDDVTMSNAHYEEIDWSGGVMERVNLARAVYQNRDIYLMDDPFSTTDTQLADKVFHRILGPTGFLCNKTRIVVTSGLGYLRDADLVVVMDGGKIREAGPYQQLMQHQGPFTEMARQYLLQLEQNNDISKPGLSPDDVREVKRHLSALSGHGDWRESSVGNHVDWQIPIPGTSPKRQEMPPYITSPTGRTVRMSSTDWNVVNPTIANMRGGQYSRSVSGVGAGDADPLGVMAMWESQEVLLVKDGGEGQSPGEIPPSCGIKWSVLLGTYFRSYGWMMLVGMVMSLLLYVAITTGMLIWLSEWSDDFVEDAGQKRYGISILAAFTLAQMLSVSGVSLFLHLGSLSASAGLHSQLLDRVMRAPLSFFHNTPYSHILAHFSHHLDTVDGSIPMYLRWNLFNGAQVLAAILLLSYTTPYFLITLPILITVYTLLQRLYMGGVRQLRHIHGQQRLPIYASVQETLTGATCIRAFGQQERFIAEMDRLVDKSQIAWYPLAVCQRWLSISLNTISTLVLFLTIVLSIFSRDSITPGSAGLAVSIAMNSFWSLGYLVRGATELETHVVSIENIGEGTQTQPEASWESEEDKPADDWPTDGHVTFSEYSSEYCCSLEVVLQDVSVKVISGEKVAVVGRTGAGKTTMALSLLRLLEASRGSILIDGVDISTLGLHHLRHQLTVLPQEPLLFSGSLRRNLDPSDSYSDDALWRVLELAHLKTFISGQGLGLQYDCGEGGQALSVGERRLVCLARALLRKTRIVILDENTATADPETEQLIQETINKAFCGCTVLVMGPRFHTLTKYDRVVVMDGGRITEDGRPSDLLNNQASTLYKLVNEWRKGSSAGWVT